MSLIDNNYWIENPDLVWLRTIYESNFNKEVINTMFYKHPKDEIKENEKLKFLFDTIMNDEKILFLNIPDIFKPSEVEGYIRIKNCLKKIRIKTMEVTDEGNIQNTNIHIDLIPKRLVYGLLKMNGLRNIKKTRHLNISVLWSTIRDLNENNIYQLYDNTDLLTSCDDDSSFEKRLKLYLNKDMFVSPLRLTISMPFYGPTFGEKKCFFAGINYEEFEGRQYNTIRFLKLLDRYNMLNLYGPNKDNWERFINYKGLIPFDGRSIIEKIKESGICLVITSQDKNIRGICSNRLFEGIAAGAVVISNHNKFIEKHFGDSIHYIDLENEILAFQEVKKIIERIDTHPNEFIDKNNKRLALFSKQFKLENDLNRLIDDINDKNNEEF